MRDTQTDTTTLIYANRRVQPELSERGDTVIAVAEDRSHLVSTSEAARQLGIAQSTLSRWVSAGIVTPTWRTAGGHMRWDVDELERQLDARGSSS